LLIWRRPVMADTKELYVKHLLSPGEDELEFFFSNFFGTSYPSIYRKEICWKPPTDVYETNKDFVVILELAQVKADEVSVTYQSGVLFIRGVRKAVPPPERRRYHKMEIHYGPFERKIAVPGDVDLDGLSASYKDGFLEIRLPKKVDLSSKGMDIEVE
jgi:HSP20 family protein